MTPSVSVLPLRLVLVNLLPVIPTPRSIITNMRRKTRSHSESSIRGTRGPTPTRLSMPANPYTSATAISPLTPTTKADTNSIDLLGVEPEGSKQPARTVKTKCPCNTSSKGKSWLLTCNICGQVWHTGCANLKGDKLTKEAVNSLLKDWQCPWCYQTPYPCPKNHMAAKTQSLFKNVNQANEFTAVVIESLETMVDSKLTEVLKTNTDSVEAIRKQLNELTSSISEFSNSVVLPRNLPPPPHVTGPPMPPQLPPKPPITIEDSPLLHNTNYIEDFVEEFLTPEEERDATEFLEAQSFVNEGGRGVLQFGEYYKYMGSKTSPKECPDIIKKIMDKLNRDHGAKHQESRYHYELNSCLVNKYHNNSSALPEHSDNEGDICPWSSIFTVSLGAKRTVLFRNAENGEETPVYCNSGSLYEMSRHSQDFYKHQIKPEPDEEDATRYSLTFRAIHWANFNSTIMIGDSNFGKVKFGVGKGKVGQATPGSRCFSPTVRDINPLDCTSYRNVVIMAGTNDLKKNISDQEICELYKIYKTKISHIRKYNPKCKILICPVLPTKSSIINERILKFNKFLWEDLLKSNLKANVVEGFIEFVDRQSALLRSDLAVDDINDILHINSTKGVRLLVSLIKKAIFRAKQSKTVNGRTYANATRGGPAFPV